MATDWTYDADHCECTACRINLDGTPPNNPTYCNHCREALRAMLGIPASAMMAGFSRVFTTKRPKGRDNLQQIVGLLVPCEVRPTGLYIGFPDSHGFSGWDYFAYTSGRWLPLEHVKHPETIQWLLQIWLFRIRFAGTPVFIEHRVSFPVGLPQMQTSIEGLHHLTTPAEFDHLRWLTNEYQAGSFRSKGIRSIGSTDRKEEEVIRKVEALFKDHSDLHGKLSIEAIGEEVGIARSTWFRHLRKWDKLRLLVDMYRA